MSIFWAKETKGLLWHAIVDGERDAKCGRYVTPPRLTMKHDLPEDDVRCAKCDKLVPTEE